MNKFILTAICILMSTALWIEPGFAQQWGADQLNGQFTSWGISNDNQIPSINLLGAWQKFKKKKEVVVAVVDTGVDGSHPYLAANLY